MNNHRDQVSFMKTNKTQAISFQNCSFLTTEGDLLNWEKHITCVPASFTCLRAFVLTCLVCLHACVLTCLPAWRACVLTCFRDWRAYVLPCWRARALGVLSCSRGLRAYVLAMMKCFAFLRVCVLGVLSIGVLTLLSNYLFCLYK